MECMSEWLLVCLPAVVGVSRTGPSSAATLSGCCAVFSRDHSTIGELSVFSQGADVRSAEKRGFLLGVCWLVTSGDDGDGGRLEWASQSWLAGWLGWQLGSRQRNSGRRTGWLAVGRKLPGRLGGVNINSLERASGWVAGGPVACCGTK